MIEKPCINYFNKVVLCNHYVEVVCIFISRAYRMLCHGLVYCPGELEQSSALYY